MCKCKHSKYEVRLSRIAQNKVTFGPYERTLKLSALYLLNNHYYVLLNHWSKSACCNTLYPTRFCLTRFSSQRNAVPPLFCSLLFPPLFLLTLTTGRRVLVCSCCFFDIFTPAPRHVAEEWGLEMKQV